MNLCRVTGSVVSTVKNPKLVGQKLLLLQPVELDKRTPRGASYLGADRVQAGVGDLVLTIKEGGGCRIVYEDNTTPVEVIVVAVVDELDVPHEWDALVGRSTLEAKQGGDA